MNRKKKPSSAWKAFDAKMRIDPRLSSVAYLSLGIVLLFGVLYAFTELDLFRWLTYVSVSVLISICIGGLIVNIRKRD